MPSTALKPPHDTMIKFGHPDSVVADYAHWVVQLRPAQATLGALVLICKEDATAFSDISKPAAQEMHGIVCDIERALKAAFSYDKINYLMLMMVDPQVHFHVLPRYGKSRSFAGIDFTDPGWPGAPDLGHKPSLGTAAKAQLITTIRENWPR